MNRQNTPRDRNRAGENDDEIQWTSVATAPDQLVAELWQQLLREEAIPSMLAPQDAISFLGVTSNPVRLMVPREMRSRAQEALAEALGSPLPPESDEAR